MSARQAFAASLRHHRQAAGLNQLELAVAIGVTEQTIRRWEHAKHDPTLNALCALAEYFGVSVDSMTHDDRGDRDERGS